MIDFKNFNRKYSAGAVTHYHRINHIFRPSSKAPMCGAAKPKNEFAKVHYVNHWRDCKKCLALYAAEQSVHWTLPMCSVCGESVARKSGMCEDCEMLARQSQ